MAEDVADGAGDWPRAFWRFRRGFPVAISWSLSAEDFADVSASCMLARAGTDERGGARRRWVERERQNEEGISITGQY